MGPIFNIRWPHGVWIMSFIIFLCWEGGHYENTSQSISKSLMSNFFQSWPYIITVIESSKIDGRGNVFR